MRADAIPLRPVRSHVALPPEAVAQIFGADYRLRTTERVEVVQRGKQIALIEARPGDALTLAFDAMDRDAVESRPLRFRGPKGVLDAPLPTPITPMLIIPDGILTAWSLEEGQTIIVALGALAMRVAVMTGVELGLHLDRTICLAAGMTDADTARWLPGVDWPAEADASDPTEASLPRRLITETDVRQARMRRQKLRVTPGQLVTPSARSLGRELGVFEEDG